MTTLEVAGVIAAGALSIAGAILAKCSFRSWEDEEGVHHWSSSCVDRPGNLHMTEVVLHGVPMLIIHPRSS